MKFILILTLLISLNSFAGDNCIPSSVPRAGYSLTLFNETAPRYRWLLDDAGVCDAIERGSFLDMKAFIEECGLTVEDAYLKITCSDNDLMGMIVAFPTARYSVAKSLKKYFERTLKKPELFSHALLSEVSGRPILRRIELALVSVRNNDQLAGTDFERRLVRMQKKYIAHLKKYPVD